MSNSNNPADGEKWYADRLAMDTELNEWEAQEDDPMWDLEEYPCPACHGTGIEDGDLYDIDETPCLDCGGWGTV